MRKKNMWIAGFSDARNDCYAAARGITERHGQ